MTHLYCPRPDCEEPVADGLLCARDTSRLRHVLRELPAAFRDLDLTATRQAKTGDGKRGRETPLMFDEDASLAREAVIGTVATWIRDLAESYGEDLDVRSLICTCAPYLHCNPTQVLVTWAPGRTMTEWCDWLAKRMHRIRAHPAVEQLWDELTNCSRLIEREVDRPADQTYLCACALCGSPVFGPDHQDEVECRSCALVVGKGDDGEPLGYIPVYSRTEEKQRAKDALMAENVPAADLRTAIHHVEGIRVNRKTVHSWITRGKLIPVEWRGDVPLFSVAEAVKRAADIPLAARDVMAVRVTDQACVVHPKWMTRDQVCALQGALVDLISAWKREGQ